MFGDDAVPKVFKGDKFVVTVDGKKANIDLSALVNFKFYIVTSSNQFYLFISLDLIGIQEVECTEDNEFQQVVQTAVLKLYQSLAPKV